MSSKRGMLVVLEGLDRSGKSTQCKRLADNLRNEGENIYHTRFPNRETTTGQMISSYLGGQIQQDDHAIHLLFSANRWESAQEIEQRIESGTTVIIDRYYYSGCVYSAAKQNPSMDLAWCRHPEVGLPRPDLCVFLDISSNEAAKRGGFGQERYERQDLQDRVRELYKKMMQHDDEYEDIVTIDAGRSFEEVEKAVLQVVTQAKTRIDQKGNDLRYVRPCYAVNDRGRDVCKRIRQRSLAESQLDLPPAMSCMKNSCRDDLSIDYVQRAGSYDVVQAAR